MKRWTGSSTGRWALTVLLTVATLHASRAQAQGLYWLWAWLKPWLPEVTAVVNDQAFLADIADGASTRRELDLPIKVDVTSRWRLFGYAVKAYRFKVGPAVSTVCTKQGGYSGWVSNSKNLKVSLASMANTKITLCLLGRSSPGDDQDLSNPTVYSWNKVTTEIKFLITGPVSPSVEAAPTVTWTMPSSTVKFDVAVAASADCSNPAQSYSAVAGTSQTLSPLANGLWYACVSAVNGTQRIPATNSPRQFLQAVPEPAPGQFSITSPTAPVTVDQPSITWSAAERAVKYDLVVARETDCTSPALSYPALTTTSRQLDILPNGIYYMCVTAYNAAGAKTEAINDALVLEMVVPGPGAFSITGPALIVTVDAPIVTWEPAERAISYDLRISRTVDCSSPVQVFAGIAGTSMQLEPLADDTWFACVTASDIVGRVTTATNSGHRFEVHAAAPGIFEITGPAATSTIETPMLTWQVSERAAMYDVVISRSIDCLNPLQVFEDLSATSQLLDPLANGTWYACVTAFDNFGHSIAAANSPFPFEVSVLAPEAFVITGPQGTVTTQTPTVSWDPSANASLYDLVISARMDCATVTQSWSDLAATSQVLNPLANGTWYVCVTAKDAAGHTAAASNNGFAFQVAYVPPAAHRVFVTSFATNVTSDPSVPAAFPSFGGLDAADWTCTYAASMAGLVPEWDGVTPSWKAILSTSTASARSRIMVNGTIINMNDEVVATSDVDLWDGYLTNAIRYNEYRQAEGTAVTAWTGTKRDGSWYSSYGSCGFWDDIGASTITGYVTRTSVQWISAVATSCDSAARLYCISQ